jgi:truncated hemoglobin YjbI
MRHDHDYPQLQHRRFLSHPEAHRPFAGSDLLARIGGHAVVETLIDRLYDRIETDALLRPLFGRDLTGEREAQKCFFSEWLGGEGEYSSIAHLPLKHRHDLLPITRALADKWLAHFRASLEIVVPCAEARCVIYEKVRQLATALVNEGEPRSALRALPSGRRCTRPGPPQRRFASF